MKKSFNNRLAISTAGIALAVLLPFSAFAAGPSIVHGNDSGNHYQNNNNQSQRHDPPNPTHSTPPAPIPQNNGNDWWNFFGHNNGWGDGLTGKRNGGSTSSTTSSTTTTANQPPTISGVSSPTVLNVGQTGTWNVSASDPQNGNLSYSVNWGDTSGIHALFAALAQVFTQTATFTHSYSTAGVYTVTFTVKDSAGLTTTSSVTVNVVTSTSGPVISNVNATSTKPHQAVLTWNTNENSDSQVWYSTTSPVSASGTPQVSHPAKVFDHSVTLTGLSAGTTYYAIVGSADSRGNLSTSAQVSFTTPGPADTAPVVTSVTGSSSIAVGTQGSWTVNAYDPRNEALAYSVKWGDTGNGIMALFAALSQPVYLQSSTFSHTYANPGTYTITFTAENTSGLTMSTTTTVTVTQASTTSSTTIPVISGVNASVIGTSTATVAWTTDQNSDSTIYYSTSTPVIGATTTQAVHSAVPIMAHTVNIFGLNASTTYYFAVSSADSAGTSTSSASSFMTLPNATSTSTSTASTT